MKSLEPKHDKFSIFIDCGQALATTLIVSSLLTPMICAILNALGNPAYSAAAYKAYCGSIVYVYDCILTVLTAIAVIWGIIKVHKDPRK